MKTKAVYFDAKRKGKPVSIVDWQAIGPKPWIIPATLALILPSDGQRARPTQHARQPGLGGFKSNSPPSPRPVIRFHRRAIGDNYPTLPVKKEKILI